MIARPASPIRNTSSAFSAGSHQAAMQGGSDSRFDQSLAASRAGMSGNAFRLPEPQNAQKNMFGGLAKSIHDRVGAIIGGWTAAPLPPIHAADPMQSNPKMASFTRSDFLAGKVDKDYVLEEYSRQPVQHRGSKVVKNEQQFEQVTHIPLAENASFDSTLATLGPALYGLTEGRHPIVDFRQPVEFPEGHPTVRFPNIIKAQKHLGFPHETRHFENSTAATASMERQGSESVEAAQPSLWDTVHMFAREIRGWDSESEQNDNEPSLA